MLKCCANATDYELEQYRATQPNVKRFLEEEELDSMEIGWKGLFSMEDNTFCSLQKLIGPIKKEVQPL